MRGLISEMEKAAVDPSLTKQPLRHHWFSRETTSEEKGKKFHTDDVSLLRSG